MPPATASPADPAAPESRSRVSIGVGVVAALAAVLILALNGRHGHFPPKIHPPSSGGGTITEEAATATRFLTTGSGTAHKFGTHEIVLTGNGSVANPFDTVATVLFTPPSGPGGAKTVDAFYDGGNTWRARVYVTETGAWTWRSASPTDPGLDNKTGHFSAQTSSFRGLLKLHPGNARAWITDNGQWWWVVVPNGSGLSTASVYAEYDRLGLGETLRVPDGLFAALAEAFPERLAIELHNDLEPASLDLRPDLARTKRDIVEAGAYAALLSGSGPTWLGLAGDADHARDIAGLLGETYPVVLCAPGPVAGAHVVTYA